MGAQMYAIINKSNPTVGLMRFFVEWENALDYFNEYGLSPDTYAIAIAHFQDEKDYLSVAFSLPDSTGAYQYDHWLFERKSFPITVHTAL